MKSYLFTFFIFSSYFLHAQILYQGSKNYYQFVEEIDSLIQNDQLDNSSKKKIFRTKEFYETRLFPSGNLIDYQKGVSIFLKNGNINTDTLSDTPEWSAFGNESIWDRYENEVYGNGRISFIKFHPLMPNTIFVGAPTGAVWVSYNDGASWQILSEELPTRGYCDMTFDTLTNTFYLLSGDFDGKSAPFYGIFKSENEGQTWEHLNTLNIPFGKKIAAHPTIADLLFLITQDSFYISNNGGVDWEVSNTIQNVMDFEFDKINENKLYAFQRKTLIFPEQQNIFYQSLDNGQTFDSIFDFSNLGLGRVEMAIHPNSNNIYLATSGQLSSNFQGAGSPIPGIFKSTDSGNSFSLIEGSQNLLSKQQYYNMVFDVYPNTDERLFAGWINLFFQSTIDTTWYPANENQYIHVDQHTSAFDPKNPDCVLIGNDGGIYRSCDFGQSWENITNNLQLTQIYHFGNSNTCEDLVLIGTQDNGTAVWYDNEWLRVGAGDGFTCGFSPNTNDTAFYSYQNQVAFRHHSFYHFIDLDTVQIFSDIINIRPDLINGWGRFHTRFILSTLKPGLLYFEDRTRLFRSLDGGENYTVVNQVDWKIFDIELSSINPNFITTTYQELDAPTSTFDLFIQYSFDQGDNWSSAPIQHPLLDTLGEYLPSAITFDPQDESKMWVAINRFDSHLIFHSSDFGMTWENYSEGLPDIHINDLLYQPYTNDALYLATDAGIYFRNDTLDTWVDYNNALPKTIFTELRISDVAEKLRASSYAMGIWEVDLFGNNRHPPISNFDCHQVQTCQGAATQWTHQSTYSPDSVLWIFEGGTPHISPENNPTVFYETPGVFNTTLITFNDWGSDTLTREDIIWVQDFSYEIEPQMISPSTYHLFPDVQFNSIVWNTGDSTGIIKVTESGWYSATITNALGCTGLDSIFIEIDPIAIQDLEKNICKIFPNPSHGKTQIMCENYSGEITFTIYNLLGKLISQGKFRENLELEINEGIYFIQLSTHDTLPFSQTKLIVLDP